MVIIVCIELGEYGLWIIVIIDCGLGGQESVGCEVGGEYGYQGKIYDGFFVWYGYGGLDLLVWFYGICFDEIVNDFVGSQFFVFVGLYEVLFGLMVQVDFQVFGVFFLLCYIQCYCMFVLLVGRIVIKIFCCIVVDK